MLFLAGALAEVTFGHGVADGGVASGWKKPLADKNIVSQDLDYIVEGQTYEGYLASPRGDGRQSGGKPLAAVLIAHQWMGLIDYEKARADEMAAMGYVVFALDVYGKGKRCSNTTCASQLSHAAKNNVTKLRQLISAGTTQLVKAFGSSDKLVAMGYCFGGGNVLELARHPMKGASEGVTYKAAVGIHASLTPLAEPAEEGEILTHVQLHHAEYDFSGDAGLAGVEKELKKGVNGTKAIWETSKYAKCNHGWTEPGTTVYNARAAIQAHKSTFEFIQFSLGFESEKEAFPIDPICQHAPPPASTVTDVKI